MNNLHTNLIGRKARVKFGGGSQWSHEAYEIVAIYMNGSTPDVCLAQPNGEITWRQLINVKLEPKEEQA